MASPQVPQHIAGADEDMQRTLELQGLLHTLLRFSWLIALCTLAAGVVTWVFVRRMPTMYRSTAVIEIQSRLDRAIDLKGSDEDDFKNPEAIETTIQNFRHRSLMEGVAKALDLRNDPAFLGYRPTEPVKLDTITDMLLAGSSATRQPNTLLIDVTYTHPDPVVARKVTNALVSQFIEQGKEERTGGLKEQNALLAAKYEELKEKVRLSEQKLQDYKQSLSAKSLEAVSVEDRRNYVEEKLRGLNGDLATAAAERRGMETDRSSIARAGTDPKQLLAIASINQDPQVAAAQVQLSKAETDVDGLLERYGEKHPRMIEQRGMVVSARANLSEAVRSAPTRLDARYKEAQTKENNLQTAVSLQEKEMLNLEQLLIPYRALLRESESDRALAESVLQKYKESTLALGGGDLPQTGNQNSGNFHVVEPAVQAVSLANRRLFIIAGAALAGALLVAGIIAALHFLDRSIRTVDTAERLLHLPVLATVPIMPKSKQPGDMLALLKNPDTPAAESFRTLRCALSLGRKDQKRVFLITSAVPGEGKSLTAVNTAIAFAQQGSKTLLVEADLRRPSLATKLLGLGEKLPGLGDYMGGQPASITDTSIPHLSLLAAGTRTPNPAELLSSAEFEELVEWMKGSYDRIVIDTAPVNVVSDTLNIVSCASSICLVVRSNSTSRKVVQRAIELLRRAGVKPDGIVLNYMPKWNGLNNHYDYASPEMYGDDGTYKDTYAEGETKGSSSVAS